MRRRQEGGGSEILPFLGELVVVVVVVIEEIMQFGHEQLDVYRVSLEYVAWAYRIAKRLQGADRHARDQLLRASQSIPQNIAEGNGKGTKADRRRFFEIARGSALECAAIQDTPGFAKGQRIQSTRHSRMQLAGIQKT